MTTRADYPADAWAALARAPFAAGLCVVLSAPSGPIGVMQEMTAMAQLLHEAATAQADNQLVTALAQALITREGQQEFKVEVRDSSAALEIVRQAGPALAGATPAEASGYRAWIVAIAERAAAAAREGGAFGIGQAPVSPAEVAALDAIRAAIGV